MHGHIVQLESLRKQFLRIFYSTLKNLLAAQQLRRGEGLVTVPESRRNERLFGVTGTSRTKLHSAGARMLKLGQEHSPPEHTCVSAFVRLMAGVATISSAAE
eukprot:6196830-Pleurochrysis_carterae.AAC.4